MATVEDGSEANLEELRTQLTSRLALLLTGTSSLLLFVTLPSEPPRSVAFLPLPVLMGLGIRVWALANVRPVVARHLLPWGVIAGLLVAMLLFSDPWIPDAMVIGAQAHPVEQNAQGEPEVVGG